LSHLLSWECKNSSHELAVLTGLEGPDAAAKFVVSQLAIELELAVGDDRCDDANGEVDVFWAVVVSLLHGVALMQREVQAVVVSKGHVEGLERVDWVATSTLVIVSEGLGDRLLLLRCPFNHVTTHLVGGGESSGLVTGNGMGHRRPPVRAEEDVVLVD
jgi:hypothetical protein